MATYLNRTNGPLPLLLSSGRTVMAKPNSTVTVTPAETASKSIQDAVKNGKLRISTDPVPATAPAKSGSVISKAKAGLLKGKAPIVKGPVANVVTAPVAPASQPVVSAPAPAVNTGKSRPSLDSALETLKGAAAAEAAALAAVTDLTSTQTPVGPKGSSSKT